MPVGVSAITALANTTIAGSSTTSLNFTSISGSYRDLIMVVNGTNSVDANLVFRFNSDSASNYNAIGFSGTGSAQSAIYGNLTGLNFNNNARIGTSLANFTLNVLDYSATDKHKTTLASADRPDAATERIAFRWSNTAAITSINILVTGGNLVAGTTFALYGVSS